MSRSRPPRRRPTPRARREHPSTSRSVPPAGADVDPPVEDDDVADELLAGGLVLVVAGRPRYHVDGCRYLNGKDVEELDVFDAQDEGFTPCGVCKPDEALAAELEGGDVELVDAAELDEAERSEDGDVAAGQAGDLSAPTRTLAAVDMSKTPVAGTSAQESVPAADGTTPPAKASKAPARAATKAVKTPAKAAKAPAARTASTPPPLSAPPVRSTAARSVPAAAKAPGRPIPATAPEAAPGSESTGTPAKTAPAAKQAKTAKAAAPKTAPAKTAPAKTAPAKTAPAKVAAPSEVTAADPSATAPAAKKGTVVVIPDRGRFHRPDCRYVRGVEDALQVSRAQATKQGFDACGVCKP